MTKTYHAAQSTDSQISWSFTVPPVDLKGAKLQLLTIGKICVTGQWHGELGEYFVAWAPLLKINHDEFQKVIDLYQQARSKQPSQVQKEQSRH